jgi:hypothetical protein
MTRIDECAEIRRWHALLEILETLVERGAFRQRICHRTLLVRELLALRLVPRLAFHEETGPNQIRTEYYNQNLKS